jgi:hypothetical protein
MEQSEKLSTVTTALGSAIKAAVNSDVADKVTTTRVDMEVVNLIIESWGDLPKKSAKQTIEKYGLPNEATQSRLIWYNNGPWKRTVVLRDEIPHNFLQPHTDVIENFIDYKVPVELFSEIAKYDGSVIIERTRGEVSARCDMEAANFIALNLMHDIVTGKYTAEEARRAYGEITSAYLLNRSAPYAEALQFTVSAEDTKDRDETKIVGAMLHQTSEKIKDVVTGNNES